MFSKPSAPSPDATTSTTRAPNDGASPPAFVALVFALSVPFWIVGATTGLELLPGLPVSALQAAVPVMAALVLVFRDSGSAGAVRLLARSADFTCTAAKAWYVVALLLMPAIAVVAYAVMRVMGLPLPTPEIPWSAIPGMFLAFTVFGLAEELGWSGYATDPLVARWGGVSAGMLLGLAWGAWHIVPLIQARRAPDWIAGWYLGTVASRIVIVWLYERAGKSVVSATLYHAMSNICWQLFPNRGSHYDPRVTGVVTAFVAAIIVFAFEPRQARVPARRVGRA